MTTLTDVTLAPREQDLMGLPIRRLLPQRAQRHCGPFVFLDHMGPHTLAPGEGLDVPPHPHIGLSTLTWLFAGEIEHRDSLGSYQTIRPGAVNWMSAGAGIVHSERSPQAVRRQGGAVEGLQFWVAQPESTEQGQPSFQHCAADTLPRGHHQGAHWTLIAGHWQGEQSPVEVDSPLCLVAFDADADGHLALPQPSATWEWGLYCLDGHLAWDTEAIVRHHLRIRNQPGEVSWSAGAHWVLMGGEPLGKRLMDWNFVATDAALIDAARQRWQQRQFPTVPGDDGYVPSPKA
ncbi:MAG: pirin family protein [Saccharospirillum sp.]